MAATDAAEEVEPFLDAALAGDPKASTAEIFASLIASIRPRVPSDSEDAARRMRAVAASLRERPALQENLRKRAMAWIASGYGGLHLAEAGILSTRGFFAEVVGRLYERILPAPLREGDPRSGFARMFDRASDAEWVAGVPAEGWAELVAAIGLRVEPDGELFGYLSAAVASAAELLAIRIAAEGAEPQLAQIDAAAERRASPFLALQREVAAIVLSLEARREDRPVPLPPFAHAEVLLEQCREHVARLRAIGTRRGTSVRTTYLLVRIEQQLERLDLVLRAIGAPQGSERGAALHEVFCVLAEKSATRLSVSGVWDANMQLLAKRVTENASRSGEHYATSDRAGYFALMRAGMGGGAVIALMALLKTGIKSLHLPPLVETALFCADYAAGFVVIQLLHFTVATKQSAMTAATLAASVEESTRSRRAPLGELARLTASVMRSQLIAIFGNIALALPVALAISLVYASATSQPLVPQEKATHMLHDLHPISGFALLHAAITGVWLFCAGLVSGWYDNRCAVLQIPARLRESPLLGWLPASTRERAVAYIDGNLGAFMGNVVFGVMLGSTAFVGILVGLPIDSRHVAFSSADLGYAAASLDLAPAVFCEIFVFVLMIGAVNLLVSFALALHVALRARHVRFTRAGELGGALWHHFRAAPREFFLPPAAEAQRRNSA